MNITQAKILSWLTAVVLALGLSAYVVVFLREVKTKNVLPEPAHVQAVLDESKPIESKVEDIVAYDVIRELFHPSCEKCPANKNCPHLNWTGAVRAAPVAVDPNVEAVKPVAPVIAVKELVRIQMVKVDMAEPKDSNVFLKYRPKSGVTNTGNPPGFLLRQGDHLAQPHDQIRIESITADGVLFAFQEGRESELLGPDELDVGAAIVQVGPDGVVMPKSRNAIPQGNAPVFNPDHTTQLGANHFVLGTNDMQFFNENYAEVLVQDVRTSSHRDPKTGKYDGIEIKQVAAGSIAERHGAQEGDVIKSINGYPVTSVQEAITFAKNHANEYTVWKIVVENKGKSRTVTYETPPK
jgi:hypothetical protein